MLLKKKNKLIEEIPEVENILIELGQMLDQSKAEDIQILELKNTNSYFNYFLIASSLSTMHCKKLSVDCTKFLKDKGVPLAYSDKINYDSGWVALDFGEVIVHIFSEENRQKYKLEELWKDARKIKI